MMRCLPFIFCAILLPLSLLADDSDEVKWGQPVGGLRLGISCAQISATWEKDLTFRVTAQNVSRETIILPSLETFVRINNPKEEDYHTQPLFPVIEQTPAAPSPDKPDYDCWGIYPDKIVKPPPAGVIVLTPGKSITWRELPLERYDFSAGRGFPMKQSFHSLYYLHPGFVFHVRFRFENADKQVAGKRVWIGQADSGSVDVRAPTPADFKLESSFTLPKTNYALGEPIEAAFTVTNKDADAIGFPAADGLRGFPRNDLFSIRAVDEHGEIVPDPITPWMGGSSMMESTTLKPGESYTEKFLADLWCAFSKPGKYKITCNRNIRLIRHVKPGADLDRPAANVSPIILNDLPLIPVETTFEVTIEENPAALNAYLSGLILDLSRDGDVSHHPAEIIRQMEAAQMPAIFPQVLKLLDGPPEWQLTAIAWFTHFDRDQAFPILMKRTPDFVRPVRAKSIGLLAGFQEKRKDPEVEATLRGWVASGMRDSDPDFRVSMVQLCADGTFSNADEILLTMGRDSSPNVRKYLGEALAAYMDARAIPVLAQLLTDPDPVVQISAASALAKFKNMDGMPVLIELLKKNQENEAVLKTLKEIQNNDVFNSRGDALAWWRKYGREDYENEKHHTQNLRYPEFCDTEFIFDTGPGNPPPDGNLWIAYQDISQSYLTKQKVIPIVSGRAVTRFAIPNHLYFPVNSLNHYWFDRKSIEINDEEKELTQKIRMYPAGRIQGKIITSPDVKPEKFYIYTLVEKPAAPGLENGLYESLHEESADSYFTTPLPIGGTYRVLILFDDSNDLVLSPPITIDVAHPVVDYDLRHEPSPVIKCQVIDEVGEPVALEELNLSYDPSGDFIRRSGFTFGGSAIKTDAKGEFSIAHAHFDVFGGCKITLPDNPISPSKWRPAAFLIDAQTPQPIVLRLHRKNTALPTVLAPPPSGDGKEVKATDLIPAVYDKHKEFPMPYRYFVPKDYRDTGKYPLILFLHGLGGRGTDNLLQLKDTAPLHFVQPSFQKQHPCFFVAPQIPGNDVWLSGTGDVTHGCRVAIEIIDELIKKYPGIDPDRIYLTGISGGGFGTWDAMFKVPHTFAAFVPISAGYFPEEGWSKNYNIHLGPIWIFLGEKDVNAVKAAKGMVVDLKNHDANPRITIYPECGHDAWDKAYSDPDLPDWLFAQSLK